MYKLSSIVHLYCLMRRSASSIRFFEANALKTDAVSRKCLYLPFVNKKIINRLAVEEKISYKIPKNVFWSYLGLDKSTPSLISSIPII